MNAPHINARHEVWQLLCHARIRFRSDNAEALIRGDALDINGVDLLLIYANTNHACSHTSECVTRKLQRDFTHFRAWILLDWLASDMAAIKKKDFEANGFEHLDDRTKHLARQFFDMKHEKNKN